MSDRDLNKLVARIKGKIGAVKRKEINPIESGLGPLFNYLKNEDLPTYEKLIAEYKEVLQSLKK